MAYIESISNEEVAALQVVQFDGPIEVVDTPQALEEACQYLAKQPILGFDTETRPSFTAGVTNKVALLQLFGGAGNIGRFSGRHDPRRQNGSTE